MDILPSVQVRKKIKYRMARLAAIRRLLILCNPGLRFLAFGLDFGLIQYNILGLILARFLAKNQARILGLTQARKAVQPYSIKGF